MCTWKVTVEIQDVWRKDAEGIRYVDSLLESANYVIAHFFLNESQKVIKNVMKNIIRITIT